MRTLFDKIATHLKTEAQDCLYISGSPSKFLQGHSLFGSKGTINHCYPSAPFAIEAWRRVIASIFK